MLLIQLFKFRIENKIIAFSGLIFHRNIFGIWKFDS